MPNPDGTMTPEERKQALLATAPMPGAAPPRVNNQPGFDPATVARGGVYADTNHEKDTSDLFGSLSYSQAENKMQGDFGLGSNNNAQTAAMIGNAEATGAKYSGQFGSDANSAGAASIAAGSRGLAPYQASLGGYNNALAAGGFDHNKQASSFDALNALAGDHSLSDFANQGPGPSAAQAQLTQATDANTQNALALARSGRGMGGSQAALRGAMAQNAVTQQGAAGQMAELRANENTAFQGQRLSALNAAQSSKLNALNAAGGMSNSMVGSDLSRATTSLAGTQYQTDTALKGTQLNDAASQAWAAQQQAAQQQGLGAEMGAQTQDLNINASALAGRESQWASANQTHGIDSGNATQAGIADANRTQAYVGGAAAAGGAVISAVSDERAKTDIQPLTAQPAPLPSQAPATPAGGDAPIASKSAADAAQKSATGSAVGGLAGSVAGGAIGSVAGPVGTLVGSAVGNFAGKALGKVFSDVRNKTAIQPLTALGSGLRAGGSYLQSQPKDPFAALQGLAQKYGAAPAATPDAVKGYAKVPLKETTALRPEQEPGFSKWLKQNKVGDLDNPDSHYDYRGAYLGGVGRGSSTGHFPDTYKQHGHPTFSIESQYSQNANDGGTWEGEKFSPAVSPKAPDTGALDAAYRRSGGTPILSKGDALLADSARGAPPSAYQYKDPSDGQGTFVGPMAQDLAKNPVTAPAVNQEPDGKLSVDGSRAALAALSQNTSQQNQLDALYAMLDDSKKKELARTSGGLDSAGNPFLSAGAR